MANKTYFKGNNKKRKNTKKYQFAGFDESMQIDNTGYLNALYNPNYYDAPTVSNEDIKQNVTADVATGQKLAMDAKVAKTGTETSLERLQRLKKEAEEKTKQQFSEANQQSKDQAIISSGTDLLTKGSDIAKQFMKPLAPATNAATTGSFSLPSNIGTFSTSGVQPGLQLGKQGINLGKGTFTSQMGTVGAKTGAEVGKQGFMSSLGSSTWATPGAAATAGGIGAGLSIGGKLWDTLSEDDNPYEYTKTEKWGDWGGNLLSDIGTYGGLGASFGPIGAGIGAVVGAGIGTVKAIRESKKNKKQAADLNAKKAEEDRLYQEQIANYNNALASQQRFYDYTKRQLRSNVLTGEEQMRQNRLMQLTEGQLAGNTNIAMTGGGRKYFGKGGAKVPGGKVVPIGQGAVEFVGRSHAKGGIMLDSQTEVEGGETMDKVMMTGGEFSDYFFSDHLKNGGKSFAQHHKELIKRGASQKEIQALAKKQEAMANKRGEKDRSPSQVAEYGGVKKYFTGGVRKYKTAGAVGDPPNKNISIEDFKKLDKYDRWELVYNIAKNLGDKFPELVASQFALESAWGTKPTGTWNFFGQTGRSNQNTKTLGTPRDPGGGSKKFINFNSLEEGIKYRVDNWSPMYKDAETVDEAMSIILKLPGKTKSGKNFADLNTRGIYASGYPTREHPEGDRGKVKDSLNNIIANAKKETNYTTLASPSPVSSKTEIPGLDFSRPPLPSGAVQSVPFLEEASSLAATAKTLPANSKFGPYTNLAAYKIPNNFGALGFKSNAVDNSKGKEKEKDKEDKYSKMYTPEQIKAAKILFGIGAGAQFVSPIASYFMKPKLISEPERVKASMIDEASARALPKMISAGSIAAPRLGRVAPDTEPILDRDTANRQFYANMGDPSSMIAMIASTSKTNEAERKAIADAQRTNVELAGKEGMLKFEASKANVASSLEAQKANQAAVSEAQGRYLNILAKNREMENQAYLAKLDAQTRTRLANAQLLADKQNRDIRATTAFGSNIAGVVGDILGYGMEGSKAGVISGDTEVYETNFIPLFGTNKSKTGEVKKKMYGGTNSYTSRLGELKFKRPLKAK